MSEERMFDKNGNEVQVGNHVICELFPNKLKIGRVTNIYDNKCMVQFDSCATGGHTSSDIEKSVEINYPYTIDPGISHVGVRERSYLDGIELQLISSEERFQNQFDRKKDQQKGKGSL